MLLQEALKPAITKKNMKKGDMFPIYLNFELVSK